MPDNEKVCFVVMGFGKKTDFETGNVFDLDKTYKNVIKPAVEDAGLKCIRADEIVHTGVIDLPMYEQLLMADVVIADISTSNKNALYELGIRHALRPYTTIVIAEDGVKAFPFDLNHVVVRQYHHLGPDIGYEEVMRFRGVITETINTVLAAQPKNDSPIYTLLNGLTPPTRKLEEKVAKKKGGGDGDAKNAKPKNRRGIASSKENPAPRRINLGNDILSPSFSLETRKLETYSSLMEKVEEAETKGQFTKAKKIMADVRAMLKAADPNRLEDPTLIQRHARATYKSQEPNSIKACLAAMEILKELNPETSNDTETLGLWGAIHKYAWNETLNKAYLDQAVRAYGRGFHLRNDYYNGINYAFLLNVRAAHFKSKAEAIADFVEAGRVRQEVLTICEPLLQKDDLSKADKYWVRATMAEAYVGLEDKKNANQKLKEADVFEPHPWMKETTEKQIAALKVFLASSPLKQLG